MRCEVRDRRASFFFVFGRGGEVNGFRVFVLNLGAFLFVSFLVGVGVVEYQVRAVIIIVVVFCYHLRCGLYCCDSCDRGLTIIAGLSVLVLNVFGVFFHV